MRLITEEPFKDSWSNCNIKDIGNLLPGSSKTVSFYIDVDKNAEAKHYKLPINISYLDTENIKHNLIKYIDIYIKPKPLFEILTKEVKVEAGKENTVLIKIKNTGNEKAERVRISAIRNSGQPFDYPLKSDSIGTLEPNETGEGVLKINVDRSAPSKEYFITLEIRCAGDSEIGDDNVYIYQKPLKVIVEGKKSDNSLLYIILLIIVAIFIIGYLFKRSK
ncbi:COG1361 S-layer family protein [Methanocaldococcus villosus]|uniref:COG1361 S-layer family protein n=1 Tax=Methanocaldococcus villosus TaxID=667126 RepID=UPI000B1DC4F0|nr:hypothetical protein [Methanocaldococcus villosus]